MVTVTTLEYKALVKNLIFFTKWTGPGSFTMSKEIDYQFFKMKANTTLSYINTGKEIEVTFDSQPYLIFLGFKKPIQKVLVNEDYIAFNVSGLFDFKIGLK